MPIHPLVVHFPVALLFAAAGFYLLSLWKKELGLAAFLLHLGGLVGCIIAILTGDADNASARVTDSTAEMIKLHQTLGMASAWGFGLLAIWPFLRRNAAKTVERVVFIVVFLCACCVLGYSAHLGGRMVYEKGVGTKIENGQ